MSRFFKSFTVLVLVPVFYIFLFMFGIALMDMSIDWWQEVLA